MNIHELIPPNHPPTSKPRSDIGGRHRMIKRRKIKRYYFFKPNRDIILDITL